MAGNNGGPWGGNRGGSGNGDDDDDRPQGGRRPGGEPPPIPEIDELMNRGREQLRVLMGGRGEGGGNGRGPAGGMPSMPTRNLWLMTGLAAAVAWGLASFYTVRPEQQSIELFLGEFHRIGGPGLHVAPWPIVTAEVESVTAERTIDIGTSRSGEDAGLMLTGDENIVDIDFQVVWNIKNLEDYKFNLADPAMTIEAVAESAMREIIAQSELAPILNRDRGAISDRLTDLIQTTLDSYQSGVNIVRVNFDKADPPEPVIASFRKVQDAEQERDRLRNVADAYANQVLAGARGQSAQIREQAEAYRAQVVNEATGQASRFVAVLAEYENAPEVTRRRLYLETMERVLAGVNLVVMDGAGAGNAVPYLPLNELPRANAAPTSTGGSN